MEGDVLTKTYLLAGRATRISQDSALAMARGAARAAAWTNQRVGLLSLLKRRKKAHRRRSRESAQPLPARHSFTGRDARPPRVGRGAASPGVMLAEVSAAAFAGAREKIIFSRALEDMTCPDQAVRARAVRALGGIRHELSVRALSVHLVGEPSAEVRRECVNALSELEEKEGVPAVECALSDASPGVRMAAVRGMYRLAGPEGASSLTRMFSDEQEDVRRRAAACTGWLGEEHLAVEVLPLLKDESVYVRRTALGALGDLGSPDVVGEVIGLLDDPEESVRKKAFDVLRTITGKQIEEELPEDEDGRQLLIARWRAWHRTGGSRRPRGELETQVLEHTPELVRIYKELGKEDSEREWSEEALRRKAYGLVERAKESNCLYGISSLIETPGISFEEILQGAVDLLPPSWQFTDITSVRVTVGDLELRTRGFEESIWRQGSDIVMHGERVGILEVFYREEKPESHEGPFLKEERILIDAVAQLLGRIGERRRAEEALRKARDELEQRVEERTAELLAGNERLRSEIAERKRAQEELAKHSRHLEESVDGRTAELEERNEQLRKEIAERKRADEALRKARDELELRVKERTAELLAGNERLRSEIAERKRAREELAEHRKHLEESVDRRTAELAERNEQLRKEIADRKRVEEDLRSSERRFKELADNIPDPFFTMGSDLRYTYWNAASERFTGIAAKDALGKSLYEIFPDVRGTKVQDLYERALRTREPLTAENEYELGGRKYTFEYTAYPFADGLAVLCRDITDRKRAEEALRESEEQYSSFLRNFQGIAYRGVRFKPTFVHGAVEEVSGRTEDDFAAGRTRWDQIIHPDDLRTVVEPDVERLHTVADYSVNREYRIIRKDGQVRWVREVAKNVCDDSGKPAFVEGVIYDITDRKRAEEELLQYQKQLRSLASELSLAEERERRRVATGVHDRIGQALATVKMKLGSLREGLESDEVAGGLEEISELVEQTIEETRSLTFELSSPVLYELGLEAALERLAEEARAQHGFSLVFEDDGQPKPLDDDVRVLLYQATKELLTNVARHAQAHNVKLSIQRSEGNVRVNVEDDGIGFDVSKLGAMTGKSGGFGLFSVRERLNYVGGSLEIVSDQGRGTLAALAAPLASEG